MEMEYLLKLNSSVYSSIEYKNKLFVCGSDWNRRKIKYSKKIAKESKGKVSIFNNKRKLIKEIEFPSMIYELCVLEKTEKIFVGSKSNKFTYNLMDSKGNLIKQRNDSIAGGMIIAIYNSKRSEVIITTRNGYLKILSEKTLKDKEVIKLSKNNRTWGLSFDIKKQIIYVGDYEGNLYVINRKNMVVIKKINFKKFFKQKGEFGPSIWGLALLKDKLLITTRWNILFTMNINTFKVSKFLDLKEDISYVSVYKKDILIGTRYGKLYSYNLKKQKLYKIKEIKPYLQKENAIWEINSYKNKVLVNFADGYVLKLK